MFAQDAPTGSKDPSAATTGEWHWDTMRAQVAVGAEQLLPMRAKRTELGGEKKVAAKVASAGAGGILRERLGLSANVLVQVDVVTRCGRARMTVGNRGTSRAVTKVRFVGI